MDVRTHLRIIWRYRRSIIAASVIVAGLILVFVSRSDAQFSAEAQLQVLTDASDGPSPDRAEFLANSYAELAQTTPVLQLAVDGAALTTSVDDARDAIDVSPADAFGFVQVTAVADTADDATALASGMASALRATVQARSDEQFQARLAPLDDQIAELRAQIAAAPTDSSEVSALLSELDPVVTTRSNLVAQPRDTLELVQSPEGTAEEVPTGAAKATLTALIVALILNSELAVGLHLLADRLFLDDADEIVAVTNLPVLATVALRDERLAADMFRELRTSLVMHTMEPIRRLAVVGAGTGTLRTSVSVGLAETMADLGSSVVLIDGDLRTPEVHRRFGHDLQPGLGDLGSVDSSLIAHRVDDEPLLRIIPAGKPVDDPARLIFQRLETVLVELADTDLVVINTPDIDRFSEAYAIAAECDATVLVLAEGDRRRATRHRADQLRAFGAHPVGVIVHHGS